MRTKRIIRLSESDLSELVKNTVYKTVAQKNKKDAIDIPSLFNFNSIPEVELKQQYIDLSFSVSSSGYGGNFIGVKGKIIKEDVSSTLSIDETKHQIQTKFHLKDWQFATQNGSNGIRLVVLYPGIFKNTKLIKEAMAACGWSLAVKGYIVRDKMIWRAMSFDPIFQDNVSSDARKHKCLYHWTPLYNFKSVSKEGLIPKSENKLFDYPNRLHLIKGDTPKQEIFNIGWQLCHANRRFKNSGDYVLLLIDLAKVSTDTEFYYDPRYEWGYYVKTKIPPIAISPIFGYNFKKNAQINVADIA